MPGNNAKLRGDFSAVGKREGGRGIASSRRTGFDASVNEHADREGYELRAIHIPKTLDNDLPIWSTYRSGHSRYELANLTDIAAKTRRLPDEFINALWAPAAKPRND